MQWAAAGSAMTLAGCATPQGGSRARVVVIGAGIGGATAAKYVKMWAPEIDVTVVERDAGFVSCPISNLVLAGNAAIGDISRDYLDRIEYARGNPEPANDDLVRSQLNLSLAPAD